MDQAGFTTVLCLVAAGDRAAVDRLFPLLYESLHKMAASHLSHERKGHTLQPTALVNEAYLKIITQRGVQFQNRAHFLALSAIMMRRVLLEHARARHAQKRGGHVVRVEFEDEAGASVDIEGLIDFDVALRKLEQIDQRQVRIVEMRYFGGLTMDEVAQTLGISLRTAEGDWRMARAWLKRELSGHAPCP